MSASRVRSASSAAFARRLAVLIAAGLLSAALLAPLVKIGVDAWRASGPAVDAGYDFGRAFRRLLQLCVLAAVLAGRRWLAPAGAIRIRGLLPTEAPWRRLAAGLALGCASFAVLIAGHLAAGGLAAAPQPFAAWPPALGFALLTGLVVALIEETIFRGWLLEGLRAASSAVPAVLLSSLLYSLAHFVTAVVRVRPGWDPLIGFRALGLHLAQPARWEIALPCLALAAIGVVLACAYLWSGSLPFAIGLHAGWVAILKMTPLALTPAIGSAWLYGAGGALAGAGGWLLIGLMLAGLRLGLRRAPS